MDAAHRPPTPPFRVDEASARLVADEFTAARTTHGSPLTVIAYMTLAEQADRWFGVLTGGIPTPVRVAYTRCASPYSDEHELSESVREHHTLEVVPARQDKDRRHPLLDGTVGGALDRLRAVHDIVSHGWHRYDFSRDGEFSAWILEDTVYRGLARWALATELHAHHSIRWTSGEVAPYKAALLDPRALARSRSRALIAQVE